MTARILVVLAMAATLAAIAAEPIHIPLVPSGSSWRFWDNVDPPHSLWNAPGFADENWSRGAAQFGYGESDEFTRIRQGEAPAITTHYFRRKFDVPRAAAFTNLLAEVLRDDGVVVYINGREVFRMNMPDGDINHFTYASSQVTLTNENFYFPTNFSPAALVEGENILAVELHQTAGPSDASFDMSLTAIGPPATPEPPSLNATHGPGGITLQWQDNDVFLEQQIVPTGSWETLTNALSPYQIPLPTDSRLFRLRRK